MDIEEIGRTLPNGFHDAEIRSMTIDYSKPEATFVLYIPTGTPETGTWEPFRLGALKLEGLLYCVIEPPGYTMKQDSPPVEDFVPEADYPWLTADSSDFGQLKSYPALPEPLPVGGFRHWFYDCNHNSFIYVAATNANFEWRDRGVLRRPASNNGMHPTRVTTLAADFDRGGDDRPPGVTNGPVVIAMYLRERPSSTLCSDCA